MKLSFWRTKPSFKKWKLSQSDQGKGYIYLRMKNREISEKA